MTISKMFSDFGRDVSLCTLSEDWVSTTFQAFVQPLRYKNKMYLDNVHSNAGISDKGYFLYLGPANHDLTVMDENNRYVKDSSKKYFVTRAEKVYFKNDVLYIWAILHVSREAES